MRDGAERLRPVAGHCRRRARRWPPSTPGAAARCPPIACSSPPGTSEGDRARAERARRPGRRGARADADLSALHGGARQARRARALLPDRSARADGCRTSIISRTRRHAGDARARRDRSEQPDRRGLSDSDADGADRLRRPPRAADSRRRGLRRSRLRRPGRAARQPRSRRADHLVLEPVEGLSSRPAGAPAGWRSAASPRLDDVLAARQEAGGRPAVQHRADAVRDCGGADRRPVAPGARSARRCKERAHGHGRHRCSAMPGVTCVAPAAAFYAMPRVDAARRPDRRGLRARRCCARPACSACTAPASACRPPTDSSASCSWRRPTNCARSIS